MYSEVHTDYIRCLAVHPMPPLVFTRDMTIKFWDWDKS